MLEKYAKDNGFENTKFLYDDGYSGTNFQRPAFEEIVELIEKGVVSTLIVKDLSRLGRNYIVSGQLLEDFLPLHNVRFIAMYDGVDSVDESSSDFIPMKNYFNELYAKDCSRKSRASIKTKAESGLRVGSRPPFGYKKDPADPKNRIVPDEGTAPILQYIFALCVSGKGPSQIASQLTHDKIPNPTHYYFNKHGVKMQGYVADDPYRWHVRTVADMLENEAYIGRTVNLRSTTLSYKHKKKIEIPKNKHFVFENTHEALVAKETWDIVQSIRKNKKRRPNMAEQNMFSGLIYCNDCGKTLNLTRTRRDGVHNNYFSCATYRSVGAKGCTSHRIKETHLSAILLDDLKRITHYARKNEKLFVERIASRDNKELSKNVSKLDKEVDTLTSREHELKILLKKIYEDNALGKINDEMFMTLSEEYQKEQNEISNLLPEKTKKLKEIKMSVNNSELFLEKAKTYTEINELTAEILNMFFEKVVVHERDVKGSKTAKQQVDIYYRDIGLINNMNKM